MKARYIALGLVSVLAIAACDKNTSRRSPKSIVPSTKCRLGLDVEDVNNKIKEKFSKNENVVVRTVIIKGDLGAASRDGAMSADRTESDTAVSAFDTSSDKITLVKNCKINEATAKGPGIESGFTGKIAEIKKDSIILTQGKQGKSNFKQVEIKKVKADKKDYAGLLAQENGQTILKLKILEVGEKKGVFEAIQFVAEKESTGALDNEVSVDVNVLKQIAVALGTETPEIIIRSIEKAGAKASIKINAKALADAQKMAADKVTKAQTTAAQSATASETAAVTGTSTSNDSEELTEVVINLPKQDDITLEKRVKENVASDAIIATAADQVIAATVAGAGDKNTNDLFNNMCGNSSELTLDASTKDTREKFQNYITNIQRGQVSLSDVNDKSRKTFTFNCELLKTLDSEIAEKGCLHYENDQAIDVAPAKVLCAQLAVPAAAVGATPEQEAEVVAEEAAAAADIKNEESDEDVKKEEAEESEAIFKSMCGKLEDQTLSDQMKENRTSFHNHLQNAETIMANVNDDNREDVTFNCVLSLGLKEKMDVNGCLDDAGQKLRSFKSS